MTITADRYSGCLLGLAMGDACGAPFEGGPFERLVWKAIGRTADGKVRYTDDTQMAMDLAHSFLQNGAINQEHLAGTFAENYRWSRGYGPAAAWILKKIKGGARWQDVNRAKFKDGSFGNGAAMRSPVLALCCPENDECLKESVVKSSEITHAHPLAIEGAGLIALVTRAALHDWTTGAILEALPGACESADYQARITSCVELTQARDDVSNKVLKNRLGNGIAATQSCVTAVYFALGYREQDFESMLDQICKLGGDADTIGAMAGAIWGAFNGRSALDNAKVERLEKSAEIIELSGRLYAFSSNTSRVPRL